MSTEITHIAVVAGLLLSGWAALSWKPRRNATEQEEERMARLNKGAQAINSAIPRCETQEQLSQVRGQVDEFYYDWFGKVDGPSLKKLITGMDQSIRNRELAIKQKR